MRTKVAREGKIFGMAPRAVPGTSAGVNEDYLQRFGGIGRLYGAAALPRLQAAHVCVVGVGGVGSWTVEGLARSGIGALTLVDLDDVCVTNINRQLPALDGQIGRPKVAVLAERVAAINPACKVTTVQEFFTKASADRLLAAPFDYVVDAIDRMSNKALLIAESRALGKRVLTVGVAGGKRDATKIQTGDLGEAFSDELLRQVRKKLRRDYGFTHGTTKKIAKLDVRCVWSTEPPIYPWADGTCAAVPEPGSNLMMDCATGFGSAVFVTGAFGLIAAGEVVKDITQSR
jgi:tRNA threonylcarbamoyladenosine dehydratase